MEKAIIRKAGVFDLFNLSKIVVDDRNQFDNPMFVKGQKPIYTTWGGLKPFVKFFIHLIHPKKQVIFLQVDSKIAGVSVINANLIEGFFVNKEYRHKGFGKMLMEKTVEEILKNYKIVRVGLRVDNMDAKIFYEKFGFKENEIMAKAQTIEMER
ncbi:MAG: GNAT family N-acetyltransferase [archaeon]|nr:GNAT family N-acetyltransferase [archaeon]